MAIPVAVLNYPNPEPRVPQAIIKHTLDTICNVPVGHGLTNLKLELYYFQYPLHSPFLKTELRQLEY
jgi:hypothetical protein